MSVAAFASTNLDNFWLLVGLQAGAQKRKLGVSAGYIAASFAVSAAAWAASAGLELIPLRWIDYLGAVPIAIGLARARAWFSPQPVEPPRHQLPQTIWVSFALTLSQSADNLAVLASLYADARRALEPAIFTTVGVCSIALCVAGSQLVSHPRLEPSLRRASRALLPLLLIAVGCHLLADASTDEPNPRPAAATAGVSSATTSRSSPFAS